MVLFISHTRLLSNHSKTVSQNVPFTQKGSSFLMHTAKEWVALAAVPCRPGLSPQRPVPCFTHPAGFPDFHQVIGPPKVAYPRCAFRYVAATLELYDPSAQRSSVLRAMCSPHCHLSLEIDLFLKVIIIIIIFWNYLPMAI